MLIETCFVRVALEKILVITEECRLTATLYCDSITYLTTGSKEAVGLLPAVFNKSTVSFLLATSLLDYNVYV